MLKLSCQNNNINNIYPINICISDEINYYKPGNKDIVDSNGNIGGLTFIKTDNKDGVISTTIDTFIINNSINNIIILKIDIEGGELNALKGATETLNSDIIKNIIIEISPKFNNDSNEILSILVNNNFDIYNIPNMECGICNYDKDFLNNLMKYPITNINNFVNSINIQTNILAIKRDIKIQKYIIIADWIETYLTQEPFLFAKELEYFGWNIIKLSKLNIETIKKSIILCITYDDFDISILKSNNYLIYKIDDLYPFKEIRNKNINNADMLIGPYQYLFNTEPIINMYSNINNTKNYNIGYSAVNDFYSDIEFNNNPIFKIFISGSVSEDIYPLRKYIKTFDKFKNNIEILEHPSYNKYTHNIINKEYYKTLNKYLCCFTDASIYKYVLLKVYEICSVGSLLLIDDSILYELNKLGFYDNINCIMYNKFNLEDKIKFIFNTDNIENINIMRKKGFELVREKHNTKQRAIQFNELVNKTELFNNNYKQIFENIYNKGLWNDNNPNIPLSGPGSSLQNTIEISNQLNNFIYNNNCKSILDLGCGDLTWISKTHFFNDRNIRYIGIDIVENQINSHINNYPNNIFYCKDIVYYNNIEYSSIIIIRDVIFHLKNNDILTIFNNIKNKFDFIAITSCKNNINKDIFDEYSFSERNIHIHPFNISHNFHIKIDEPIFNRMFYIYTHNNFYNV